MTSGGNKFSDFRESQLSKFRKLYTVRAILPSKKQKQLFLSSRKYLFHSQIASAIDLVNQIFYEYDSSDIPAYAVRFSWTDCYTRHGVHV